MELHKKIPNLDKLPNQNPGDEWGVVVGALNLAYAVLGAIAVGFIIYAGISYITSSGDPVKATKAKKILIYAIIGLVLVGAAAVITNFVIGVGA